MRVIRQIAASRRFRDIELLADLQDRNVADLGEKFGDGLTAGFNDVSGYFHKVGARWVWGSSFMSVSNRPINNAMHPGTYSKIYFAQYTLCLIVLWITFIGFKDT